MSNTYPKTENQLAFEHATKLAFPEYYDYEQSDLYRGDYRDSDTRHTFAGYVLGLIADGPAKKVVGYAIVSNDGVISRFRAKTEHFFGNNIVEKEQFSTEYCEIMDRDYAGRAPHTVIELFS